MIGAEVTLVPWDSLKIKTGRVWSPIEGRHEMIKETDLTEYSSRCNAVRKNNGSLNVLRSQCERNGVQKSRDLSAADPCERYWRPFCDWES